MRYPNVNNATLYEKDYELIRDKLNKEQVVITRTVSFGDLKNKQIGMTLYGTWKQGSSLIKIANEVYGDASMWWTIGLINAKPTDQHFKIGDEIYTPVNPERIKLLIESGE